MSYSPDIKKLLEGNEAKNNNDLGMFEYLKLIPLLIQQNQKLIKEVELLKEELIPKLDLTKRSAVKKYLGIDEGALKYRMSNGILLEGKHYIKEIKENKPKITFIESAIIEFRKGLE